VALGGWMFGAPGVLIGQAVGGLIFGLLAAWMALRVITRGGDGGEAAAPRAPFARQARLMSLLHLRR
jgi:hypothetical protein